MLGAQRMVWPGDGCHSGGSARFDTGALLQGGCKSWGDDVDLRALTRVRQHAQRRPRALRPRSAQLPRLRDGGQHARGRRRPVDGLDGPRRDPVGSPDPRALRPRGPADRLGAADVAADHGHDQHRRHGVLRDPAGRGRPGHRDLDRDHPRRGARPPGRQGQGDAGSGTPRAAAQPAHRRVEHHVLDLHAHPRRRGDRAQEAARGGRHPVRHHRRPPHVHRRRHQRQPRQQRHLR